MMINALWEDFQSKVIPADAAEFQRQEMRRAFYAGAVSAFGICTNTGEKTEAEAMVDLTELRDDLMAFKRKIGDGF